MLRSFAIPSITHHDGVEPCLLVGVLIVGCCQCVLLSCRQHCLFWVMLFCFLRCPCCNITIVTSVAVNIVCTQVIAVTTDLDCPQTR